VRLPGSACMDAEHAEVTWIAAAEEAD
jgi:hypothetical protein